MTEREREKETFVTFSQAITVLALGTRSRQSRTVYSVSAKVCYTFLTFSLMATGTSCQCSSKINSYSYQNMCCQRPHVARCSWPCCCCPCCCTCAFRCCPELSLGGGRANVHFVSGFDLKKGTYVFDKEGEHGNLHYRQTTKGNSRKIYIENI